jgi:hypothetical protein
MLSIPRKSPVTGQVNYRDIDITQAQLVRWLIGHELIQDVMPHISPEDREFLISGCTPEDWATLFQSNAEQDI